MKFKMIAAAIMAAAIALLAPMAASAAPAGWPRYGDPKLGFSISYPPQWKLDTHYVSASLGPDHPIYGVAFHIPASVAAGTNLSDYTSISVESIPGTSHCKPSQFVDPAENVRKVKADGRTYSAADSEDAGAGQRFETELFVVDGTAPCIAVRYFIRSSAFENFDPGSVKRFNRAALIRQFDAIRATLKVK
jgi:hypothetical protein